jgi:hypothetical protein
MKRASARAARAMAMAMRADGGGNSVTAAVTVAMAVAGNNRNCWAGNNQQNAADGNGSSGDSGRGSSNRCSAAATAGRGGSAAEVIMMRAVATATGRFIHEEGEMVEMRGGEVVTWNLFMICDFFTLISSVPVDRLEGFHSSPYRQALVPNLWQ